MRLRYHHAVLCVCLLATAAPVQAQKKDDAPPEPAVAPFDAKKAEEHQKAWAKHIGVRDKLRNSIGMDLMLIPPGEFLMGSPAFEEGRNLNYGGPGEEVQHKVTLTKLLFLLSRKSDNCILHECFARTRASSKPSDIPLNK